MFLFRKTYIVINVNMTILFGKYIMGSHVSFERQWAGDNLWMIR